MTVDRRWSAILLTLVFGAALSTGCVTMTSPDAQLYTLNATGNGATPNLKRNDSALPVLAVGPVDLPDYLRRPQIVSRVGENRIQVAEFDRWAAPLNEQVERVLAENLAARVEHLVVVNYREQRFRPRYRLTMTLERFERQDQAEVQLAGRWTIAEADSGTLLLTRRERFTVPIQGQGYEAGVAAQSRALARLADEMSNALREVLNGTTPPR